MAKRNARKVLIEVQRLECRRPLSHAAVPVPEAVTPARPVSEVSQIVTTLATRRDVMYRRVTRGGPTYRQVVEEIFTHIFPSGGSYQGVSVSRDNVIAERIESNGQGGYWLTVRARYSGRVKVGPVSVPVAAERVRIYYDNGGIRMDLGGFKGAIDTRSIGRYVRARLPKSGFGFSS